MCIFSPGSRPRSECSTFEVFGTMPCPRRRVNLSHRPLVQRPNSWCPLLVHKTTLAITGREQNWSEPWSPPPTWNSQPFGCRQRDSRDIARLTFFAKSAILPPFPFPPQARAVGSSRPEHVFGARRRLPPFRSHRVGRQTRAIRERYSSKIHGRRMVPDARTRYAKVHGRERVHICAWSAIW